MASTRSIPSWREQVNRSSRFEQMEARLPMTADSVADFQLDYLLEQQVEQQITDSPEEALYDEHQLTGFYTALSSYGFTGVGQTVAVIDSGIAYDHSALGGGYGAGYRVVGGYDFTESDNDPYDDGPAGSHGTHVAGIIGSTDSTSRGVASSVDLVGLRVFDDSGAGYFSWVEQALQWVHNNRNNFANPITTVNLSIGATWNADTIPNWATLEDEFAQLEADGIFISVAAGNSFTTYNATGVSYPAASPYVVPVASVDDDGSISYFSQRNDRVIAAPGRSVRSTVPDYAGNNNGIADDFAYLSGTSMAAPYVAGASVLLRQALDVIGTANITQDMIYNVMRDTAVMVYDSATNQSYYRLDLNAALDSIMPDDDFGSTAGAAFNLGSVSSTASASGLIGTLDDNDFFTFTATASGTATWTAAATHELAANWDVTGLGATVNGNQVSFSVVAGQNYAVGIGTSGGLGNYNLNLDIQSADVGLGTVDFLQLSNVNLAQSETSYTVIAANSGTFTFDASFTNSAGDVNLEVYNSSNQLLGSSTSTSGTERIDLSVTAGDSLRFRVIGANADVDLRLTNMVSVSGGVVTLLGSSGNDVIDWTAGATHQLTVNGVAYQFNSGNATTFVFTGGAGVDSVTLRGDTGNDKVTVRVGSVVLSGSGYDVSASSVENISVYAGGGNDWAYMYDSAGNDTFTADPTSSRMTGTGFDNYVNGFDLVFAKAGGGRDVATLQDSSGDDDFLAYSHAQRFSGAGFYIHLSRFEAVTVNATAGGNDTATLNDSWGNDTFTSTPTEARMVSARSDNRAVGFDTVYGKEITDGTDGTDIAYVYGSSGNDVFTASPTASQMTGAGFDNNTVGFDLLFVKGGAGSNDVATLQDSSGNDDFSAYAHAQRFSGAGFYIYLTKFEAVTVNATAGGNDTATLYDSWGNDTFTSTPTEARMVSARSDNRAVGFDTVYGKEITGDNDGTDMAYVAGSAGDDIFTASPTSSRMTGAGFDNYTVGFDLVFAKAGSGRDVATLQDSSGDDDFSAYAHAQRFSGAGFYIYLTKFDAVTANATAGGNDTATLYDSWGNDTFTSTSTDARMVSTRSDNRAVGFDTVYGKEITNGSDGTDVAYVYDSSGDDVFTASPTSSRMTGAGFDNNTEGFDAVYAESINGGNDLATLNDSAGDDDLAANVAWSRMMGTGYYNRVAGFDSVIANSSAGGFDVASLYDSSSDDLMQGRLSWARLSGTGFSNQADGFDQVDAHLSAGGSDTVDVLSVDYIFNQMSS